MPKKNTGSLEPKSRTLPKLTPDGVTPQEAWKFVMSKVNPIEDIIPEGGSIDLQSMVSLVSRIVQAAEQAVGTGKGELKLAVALAAWNALDQKFSLIKRMDDWLKLPPLLERWDAIVIEKIVIMIVKVVVASFNAKGW